MNKKNLWCVSTMIMVILFSFCLTSCGKEDISDPEGTISLSMRNRDNGDTSLGNYFRIDNENFTEGYFVSLGKVKGLGYVNKIPTLGWANEVAVIPGNGYIAYDEWGGKYNFYRIYVSDYIISTTGGIIGAEVKYQAPYYGTDEKIVVDKETIKFSISGQSNDIIFKNSSFIPFDYKIDVNLPYIVEKISTYDSNITDYNGEMVLSNGVRITIGNYDEDISNLKGSIKFTTMYGKTTTVNIVYSKD